MYVVIFVYICIVLLSDVRMRKVCILLIFTLLCLSAFARRERDTLGVGSFVSFVENAGQWEPQVAFKAQVDNGALFFEADGITVVLHEPSPHPYPAAAPLRYHAYKMRFAGTEGVWPSSAGTLPGHNNYFLGNNQGRWRSGVREFATVRYEELYEGVDLEVFSATNVLKYNFIVAPEADVSQIVMEYIGTDGVQVGPGGNLVVRTSVRDVVELKPFVYQEINGHKSEVESEWKVESGKWKTEKDEKIYRVRVRVGEYDRQRPLVVDPMLVFSTYTGSRADNWGTTAAYDSHKNVYTAGVVFEVGYPTSLGAYSGTYAGNTDIGIFKFDTNGHNRLYATYLGGSEADIPHSLYVNSFDELIVFGTTGSADFPVTSGAYSTTFSGGTLLYYEGPDLPFPNGSDIFVSRFSTDGSQLPASTFVGGSGNDGLNYRHSFNTSYSIIMAGNDSLYYNYGDGARGEIITDNQNNVYVGSTTFSTDFPTTEGCVQPASAGRQEGVVFKLDHNLRNMLWSTYLGGGGDDAVYSIDVDSSYNLLVCGGTNSHNFPTLGANGIYQSSYGGGTADGFVCKIAWQGNRMIASSYVGSELYDQLYFVRTGRHDEVFLYGQTRAQGSTMIHNAGYGVPGSGMLLMRLERDLSSCVWSTVFGTPGRINLSPTAFAADICNRVYAAGWGRDFVNYNHVEWYTAGTTGMETSLNAYCDSTDGQDFYIMSMTADASRLDYATFFGEPHKRNRTSGGGDHVDGGTSRFDRLGALYQSVCASCGGTNGFPVTDEAWSDSNLSAYPSRNCNNAIFCFRVTDDYPVADFLLPSAGCAPYNLQFHFTGRGDSLYWDFGDGSTSTERNPMHTYTLGGTYVVRLIATMPNGCSVADTQYRTVYVIGVDHAFSDTPDISCNNDPIQIGPTPSVGVTYQWLTDGVSDPTVANPWVTSTGTYLLRISAQGCSETDTFEVLNYRLVDQWQVFPNKCRDSLDGYAVFHMGVDYDADSVHFTLQPAAPYHMPDARTIVFNRLQYDVPYHFTLSAYGCHYEQDFTAPNSPPPAYSKEVDDVLCTDSCTGRLLLHYHFSVIPEAAAIDTLITGLCEGTHITFINDTAGCPFYDTTVVVRDHTLDGFHAWADASRLFLGESVRLHAVPGGDNVFFFWTPEADLDDHTAQNPLATPSDTMNTYYVQAINSATGCKAGDSVVVHGVEVVCGPQFFIPNAFTPNGDGVNDYLTFFREADRQQVYDMVTSFHIVIFNRWGERVFETEDINAKWDGNYHNNHCMPGVYTYSCVISCQLGEEYKCKGDITLIR